MKIEWRTGPVPEEYKEAEVELLGWFKSLDETHVFYLDNFGDYMSSSNHFLGSEDNGPHPTWWIPLHEVMAFIPGKQEEGNNGSHPE